MAIQRLSPDDCWRLFKLAICPGTRTGASTDKSAAIGQRVASLLAITELPDNAAWARVREASPATSASPASASELLEAVFGALLTDMEIASSASELLRLPLDVLSNILQRVPPGSSLLITRHICVLTLALVTSLSLHPPHHHLLHFTRSLAFLELHFPPFSVASDASPTATLATVARVCTGLCSLVVKGRARFSLSNVAQIARVTSLQRLSLACTPLPASALPELTVLARLTCLDLSACPVQSLESLVRLSALRDLDIRGLETAHAHTCVSRLVHLTRLALTSSGRGDDALRRVLQLCSGLQSLQLAPGAADGCRAVADASPQLAPDALRQVAAASGLHALDVSAFWASLPGPSAFSTLAQLRSLRIKLAFSDGAAEPLATLSALTLLDLAVGHSATRQSYSLAPLAALPRLSDLTLRCLGSGAELHHLAAAPALEALALLDASHHVFADAGLQVVRDVAVARRLSSLSLAGCEGVGDYELQFLAALTTLTSLDLARTCLRGPGLAHLAALPGLLELRLSGDRIMLGAEKHLARMRRSTRVVVEAGTAAVERRRASLPGAGEGPLLLPHAWSDSWASPSRQISLRLQQLGDQMAAAALL